MILDGILDGILDQGQGQLVLYEDDAAIHSSNSSYNVNGTNGSAPLVLDTVTAKGLQVVQNMDAVVTSLLERSKALRTVMM